MKLKLDNSGMLSNTLLFLTDSAIHFDAIQFNFTLAYIGRETNWTFDKSNFGNDVTGIESYASNFSIYLDFKPD